MMVNMNVDVYKRKVTPLERMFNHSPYAMVTMVTRIKGEVTEGALTHAVLQVQRRHPNLRVRIKTDNNHKPWFTSDGVEDIPIDLVPRESNQTWKDVFHQACHVPFDFERRPAIRFILVQSPDISEVIIFCHHIICDGLSLAYLARDLLNHLGDPALEAQPLPDPVLMDLDSLPDGVTMNPIARFFVRRINSKWETDPVQFDGQDYSVIHEAYWNNFTHRMETVELTEAQTAVLVKRCRDEGVTVNSAIAAAFSAAQSSVLGEGAYDPRVVIAGNLRDRLKTPAGEVMGFYAGAVSLKYEFDHEVNFWENARQLHRKVQPLYTDKKLFSEPLTWCHLHPAIMESLVYKMIGRFVPSGSPRYQKLSGFSNRDDVVSSILKREKMDSLDNILIGTAVTNLTRLDFPRQYGDLELDRLILNPGGAYPLALVNLVVGAVTCAGKLSLVLEYEGSKFDPTTMEEITNLGVDLLLR